MTEAAMNADPLRAYVRTLREGRGLSQPALARKVGMGESTYIAWERGTTRSIKDHFLRRIVETLQGSLDHLDPLDQMNPQEARTLALEWMELTPEEQRRSVANSRKVREVIELLEEDPPELAAIIEEIRQDARIDPGFLVWLTGFLAGRRGGARPR